MREISSGKSVRFIKMALVVLLILQVVFVVSGIAEDQTWNCPKCGRTGNTGNYCGGCAHPAPWIQTMPNSTPASISPTKSVCTPTPGPTVLPAAIATANPASARTKEFVSSQDDRIGLTVQIISSSAKVRSQPDKNAIPIGTVLRNQNYIIMDVQTNNDGTTWFQIRVLGQEGWIASGVCIIPDQSMHTAQNVFADSRPVFTVRVITSSARVRSEPDKTSSIVATVLRNQTYSVYEIKPGESGKSWYRINVLGQYGWIASGVCEIEQQ